MVQFECPRVIHPLVSFTFGVHCRVSFSPDAGKGKYCMWLVNKVEIYFSKICCSDPKPSNLNAPGSYINWCPFSFGVFCRVSLYLDACAHVPRPSFSTLKAETFYRYEIRDMFVGMAYDCLNASFSSSQVLHVPGVRRRRHHRLPRAHNHGRHGEARQPGPTVEVGRILLCCNQRTSKIGDDEAVVLDWWQA